MYVHLKPMTARVISPATGRYPSMTYTRETLVPCAIEKFTENDQKQDRKSQGGRSHDRLTETEANGGTYPVELVLNPHAI